MALVAPNDVNKPVFLASAASVIIVHPHPSAEFELSLEDRGLTAMLKKAGELLGIEVLDHVIIGQDSFYSFAERDELCPEYRNSRTK